MTTKKHSSQLAVPVCYESFTLILILHTDVQYVNCMQQRRKHSVLVSFDWSSSKLQANYEQYYWENAMFVLILP